MLVFRLLRFLTAPWALPGPLQPILHPAARSIFESTNLPLSCVCCGSYQSSFRSSSLLSPHTCIHTHPRHTTKHTHAIHHAHTTPYAQTTHAHHSHTYIHTPQTHHKTYTCYTSCTHHTICTHMHTTHTHTYTHAPDTLTCITFTHTLARTLRSLSHRELPRHFLPLDLSPALSSRWSSLLLPLPFLW